ncbi:MAG TPA: DUF1579 family protein [Thermoanaerobaculia bacterium]
MRKFLKVWFGVAALLVALPLAAQQTAKEAERHAGNPMDYDKILKPADMHEILGRFVGTWNTTLKALVYGVPLRETTMKDTFVAKWILDERFIELEYTYDLGVEGGVSKGKVIMGYNGATKQFFRHFFIDWDSRGTFSDGVFIRSKNALVFEGKEHDPITGDTFVKRDVFTFGPDKDKFHYEQYYRFADGSEVKPLEGDYIRVKEPVKP